MLLNLFIALGAAAFILMVLATLSNLERDTNLVFTIFSFVLWVVWALQAPSVRVVTDSGTETVGYSSLLIIGMLFAAVMAVSILMQALELFGDNF